MRSGWLTCAALVVSMACGPVPNGDGGTGGGAGGSWLPVPPGPAAIEHLDLSGAVVAGKGRARVVLRDPVGVDTSVELSSLNPTVAHFPAAAVVPAGGSSAEVDFDGLVPGAFSLTASVDGTSYTTTSSVVTSAFPNWVSTLRLQTGVDGIGSTYLNLSVPEEATIALSTSDPGVATVPASVRVARYSSGGYFPVHAVAKGETVLTASYDGMVYQGLVYVTDTNGVSYVSLSPSRVLPDQVSMVYVSLFATAAHDTQVALTSTDPSVATVPAMAIVRGGSSYTYVPATIRSPGLTVILAELGSTLRAATLQVVTAPSLSYFSCPSKVVMGLPASCSFSFDMQLATDTPLSLSSDQPGVLQVPASAVVPAGADSAVVPVTGLAAGNAQLTATLGASSRSTTLTVVPPAPAVSYFYVSPGTGTVGTVANLYVNLVAPVATEQVLTLTSSNPAVFDPPNSLVIAAGSSSASASAPYLAIGNTTVTVTLGGASYSTYVYVVGNSTWSVSSSQTSLERGAVGYLSLSGSPTPVSPPAVSLALGTPGIVAVPSSVSWPVGANSTVVPLRALAAGTTTLTVTVGGQVWGFTLTVVNVASVSAVSVSFNHVTEPGTVRVTLDSIVAADKRVSLSQATVGGGVLVLPPSLVVPTGSYQFTLRTTATAAGALSVTASADGAPVTVSATVPP